jgi:hypothetical protein
LGAEVIIIVNMDVAVALWMGIFRAKTIIGTTRTPPPIPKSPEASPPKKLNPALKGRFFQN